MVKVIIIGGGIAGLAAATFLSLNDNFQVHLYEREHSLGGQARSGLGEKCFIEYSWRIFGGSYANINYIISLLGIENNFDYLKSCLIDEAQQVSYYLNSPTRNLVKILKESDSLSSFTDTLNKLLNLTCICKQRALTEYNNTNAYNYFNQNKIMQTVLGPFLGMDANKVSVSGFYKALYGLLSGKGKKSKVTTLPTQQALFDPWKAFLVDHNVKISLNKKLDRIHISPNQTIQSLRFTDGTVERADEFIFACSLDPLVQICTHNSYLNQLPTISNLKTLRQGLQLYFTINMYFSIQLPPSDTCSEMIIINMPWKPIIQKKRRWGSKYTKNCRGGFHKQIKDIWNVGFLDYNEGIHIKKNLHNCSLNEAIAEGVHQVKSSKYIQNLLQETNTTFEDVYLGSEHWYEFKNGPDGTLISTNPKFSINTGLASIMPTTHPPDLPRNMYLAGYYVTSTMGGVSMESSCETGFLSGKMILDKYRIENYSWVPLFSHDAKYFTKLTIPLVELDRYLYKRGLEPITSKMSPLQVWGVYLLIILFVILVIIKLTTKYFLDRES